MDADQKKTALRMIPYGLDVLTAQDKSGARTAATVNWVTQTSFEPPLVVVGVKADSHAKTVIGAAGTFALNFLGKGQEGIAYAFFKSVESDGQQIGGQPYRVGTTGAPILTASQPSWNAGWSKPSRKATMPLSLVKWSTRAWHSSPKGVQMMRSCG